MVMRTRGEYQPTQGHSNATGPENGGPQGCGPYGSEVGPLSLRPSGAQRPTTCHRWPAASRFTNNRAAPGLPAGSWRKKANVV